MREPSNCGPTLRLSLYFDPSLSLVDDLDCQHILLSNLRTVRYYTTTYRHLLLSHHASSFFAHKSPPALELLTPLLVRYLNFLRNSAKPTNLTLSMYEFLSLPGASILAGLKPI